METGPLIRGFRLIRFALRFIGCALVALVVYPACGDAARQRLKARLSAGLLGALGIEVVAETGHVVAGALLVANHVSWVDIFAINAVLPAAFVSKEEVRRWPLIGWLAVRNDTVFLRRGSRGHAKIINREIADILATGQHVAVFPEGTTTDGTHLLHFHAALIQPALAAGRPVVPVAISYREPDGTRSPAPRYDGDITLGQCLRAILARRRLIAHVNAMPALGMNGEDRRQVAADARAAICAGAGLPPPA